MLKSIVMTAALLAPLQPQAMSVSFNGDVDPAMTATARTMLADLNAHPEIKTVELYINSYGGSVDEMNTILDIMDILKARGVEFTCTVDSKAMSAGAMILMNCNKINVWPRSLILFHVGSTGNIFASRVVNPKDDKYYFPIAVKKTLALMPLFTNKEAEDFRKGIDVFITGEDLMNRLRNH